MAQAYGLIKIPFYDWYTEREYVPDVYSKLFFNKDRVYLNARRKENDFNFESTYSVSLFPSYLQPTPAFDDSRLAFKQISQKKIKGFAIDIDNDLDFETTYKENYSKSFRNNIKRFVNRFETCFNAEYLMFFGNITESEYERYMGSLKTMLNNRFQERGEENRVLNNWNDYYRATFDLIKAKKCSLFVIKANNETVHVCINRHNGHIINIAIPSYDITYSKFSLGNISIFKLLKWSIENKYKFVDLEYGIYEYKRRWSNKIYEFHHHIFYNSKKPISRLLANIEYLRLKLKNVLKSINIDELIGFIKRTGSLKQQKKYSIPYTFEIIPNFYIGTKKEVHLSNLKDIPFKRAILDVSFYQKIVVSKIKIFIDPDNLDLCYLIGEQIKIKIEFSISE